MSRLYWSNLPDAKRPRGGTSTLWTSLTTEDLPIPEYPETSTNSGTPLATTRSKEASKVSISRLLPYSFSGINSRSGVSCSPSGNSSPLRDLPPQDAQGRFQLVFQRFIGVFARPEQPVALFLDDLQWLDAATLD